MYDFIMPVVTTLITSGVTLLGVIISNRKSQAVTEFKIEELTREVREHNNFAKRMPVVEEQIATIKEDISELKGYHKQ